MERRNYAATISNMTSCLREILMFIYLASLKWAIYDFSIVILTMNVCVYDL